jgi:aryl-alcohol dehydrogenase-like predicted oxidoreductase
MTKRKFGKTGFDVSVLGYGTAPAAYLETERRQTVNLIESLLDAGVNLIDTAASYPGSEEFIGEHLSHRRGDFVLVSKCGTRLPEIDAPPFSADLVSRTVDRALRLLKTDSLDVMLLHSCDLPTLMKGEALGALVEARDAGKIKFAGYSGDNDAAAYAASLPDVAVVQTSISVVDQVNIDRALPVAAEENVGVMAKRPIANAAWKELSQQPGMYQGYAKEYTERFGKLSLTPFELGFPGDPAAAWPEIAIRFTLSFPQVSTAIIGTTNPENARRNIAYVEKGPLPAEAVAKIRDAFRRADPRGEWKGQT